MILIIIICSNNYLCKNFHDVVDDIEKEIKFPNNFPHDVATHTQLSLVLAFNFEVWKISILNSIQYYSYHDQHHRGALA